MNFIGINAIYATSGEKCINSYNYKMFLIELLKNLTRAFFHYTVLQVNGKTHVRNAEELIAIPLHVYSTFLLFKHAEA